jgi:hypothetical protein
MHNTFTQWAAIAAIAFLTGAVTMAGAQEATPEAGQGRGNRGNREGRGQQFDPAQMFQRLDTNGDGIIDSTEFRGPAEFFARMDTNNDGKVTREEFDAGRQQMRQAGGRAADGQRAPGGWGAGPNIDALQQTLGLGAEEWAVLKPRIEKVITARQATMGRGAEEMPEAAALRTALENKDTPAEELEAKSKALREARAKKAAELKAAREALRELLTPRQEARLILDNILD